MEVLIDGQRITIEKQVTVLEAARKAGVTIPTLCWHPRVSVLGACRLCLVEIEGIPRLLAACTTQISDGMSVITDSPQLRKVREIMLELLLCRHPMDCPTCVKGGECELQELTYRCSAPENRFPENPAPYPVSDPSPFVERDPKKCVLCRRCVRGCREVRGRTVLGAMERGYHKRVGTYFQQNLGTDFQDPYSCEFCGSCINICPVGALNSKVRKFRARTWEGDKFPSVCPFCSVGCLLELQVKEDELVRSMPRWGPNNEDQACFRGRFGVDYVNASERIISAQQRRDGKLIPVEAGEALRSLAERARSAGSVEAMVSSSCTREEMTALRDFMGSLFRGGRVGAVDTLGLDELTFPRSVGTRPWEDMEKTDCFLVAGQDFSLFEPVAGVRVRLARSKTGAGLLLLDGRDTLLGSEADAWFRPPGSGLPALLGALIMTLAEEHGERLKSRPEKRLLDSLGSCRSDDVEKSLGLAEGTVAETARRIAASGDLFIMGHRGWHDPEGKTALLLTELDRILSGDGARGIAYLGKDCNSRGAADLLPGGTGEGKGVADLLFIVGADPRGSALPSSAALRRVRDAGTVVVVDSFPTATSEMADFVFPLPTFTEKEGTVTAASGLTQRLTRSMEAPPTVLPLWDLLDDLAGEMGQSLSFAPSFDGAGEGGNGSSPPAPLPELACAPPPAAGTRLVLRAIRVGDHRLRKVKETPLIFPETALEIHPSDLEKFGLEEGGSARLISGSETMTLSVKSRLTTPPGEVHLPYDPANGVLASFAAGAEQPEGWPEDWRVISSLLRAEEGQSP